MYIYVVYYVLILFTGLFIDHKQYLLPKIKKCYFGFIATALIALIGFRAESVGVDTSQYAYIWNYDIKAGNYNYISTQAELGYYYLQTFFKQFIDYQSFLMVIGIISIIPIIVIFYRYSLKCGLTFLLFYASIPFHTLEFAAARQALAFTCVIVAFHFLMKRNLKKYLLMILLAMLFHQTAIIFLPSYWLYDLKINKKTMIIWGGVLLLSFLLANSIFSFLNSFSRIDYSDNDVAAGGERLFGLTVCFVMLGFLNRDKINNNPIIRMPFVLYCLAPLLWPFLHGNPALFRLQYYFDFFLCLFVPNIISVLPQKNKIKTIFYILSLFLSLYVVLYMRTSEAYYPYYFFWEK